jgi:hypothetical protein
MMESVFSCDILGTRMMESVFSCDILGTRMMESVFSATRAPGPHTWAFSWGSGRTNKETEAQK